MRSTFLTIIAGVALAIYAQPSSTDAERYYNEARRAFLVSDYATAAREISEALRLNPNSGPSHRLRGSIFSKLNKLDDALIEYQEAIRLDERDADSYYNIGWVYDQKKKLAEAEAAYSKAIELKPDAEAYNNRGWVRLEAKRYNDARPDFVKAIQLNNKYLRANLNLGLLESRADKPAEAVAAFTRALELDPSNVSALEERAIAYDKLKKPNEAKQDRDKAAALRALGIKPSLCCVNV